MKSLQKAARHVARYRFAYLAALFLLIAATTCGVMTGSELELEMLEGMEIRLSAWRVMGFVAQETVCAAALLLADLHPFGCGLAAALLAYKGFSVGYCWGWWMARFGWSRFTPFLLAFMPQGVLSLGSYTYLCCATAYSALHIERPMPRERLRALVTVWIIQMIAVLLRCIGCAWAAG